MKSTVIADPREATAPLEILPAEPEGSVRPNLTERPADFAAVLVSAIFVALGLASPQAADLLLRLFFVTVALGYVALHAFRTLLPVTSSERIYSPFDGRLSQSAPAAVPLPLRDIELELEAAESAWGERRRTIPDATVERIRKEVAKRLIQRHALNLHDSTHHPRIRALVSEPTWSLLLSLPYRRASSRSAFAPPPVPLAELNRVLDDLEKL